MSEAKIYQFPGDKEKPVVAPETTVERTASKGKRLAVAGALTAVALGGSQLPVVRPIAEIPASVTTVGSGETVSGLARGVLGKLVDAGVESGTDRSRIERAVLGAEADSHIAEVVDATAVNGSGNANKTNVAAGAEVTTPETALTERGPLLSIPVLSQPSTYDIEVRRPDARNQ